MNGAFRTVAIEELLDSRTNPRRHFSEHGMDELEKSIADQGVLVPLLVRPVVRRGKPPRTSVAPAEDGKHDHLEVIAGSRRLKAARAIGLKEIPVRVVELSDNQALEVQVIENLQREDVHPLDEAQGYRALMATGQYDASALALKLGKSESYVYQRLKLNDLIKPLQKLFWEEKIGLGHALLLARLQPHDQQEVLGNRGPHDFRRGAMSPAELAGWIDRVLLLHLKGAPFKLDDAELLPKAGSCEACPKRTGAMPQLFPDIKAKDTCTDRSCYERKVEALVARRIAEYSERGEPLAQAKLAGYVRNWQSRKGVLEEHTHFKVVDSEACDHARPAIVVVGDDVGKVIQICTDTKCKAHAGAGRSAHRRSPQELAAERKRKEAMRRQDETFRRIRCRLVEKLAPKEIEIGGDTITLGRPALHALFRGVVERTLHDDAKELCKELNLEAPLGQYKQKDFRAGLLAAAETVGPLHLFRLLATVTLRALYEKASWYTPQGAGRGETLAQAAFKKLAAERGVNVKQIAKQVTAEAEAAEKEKAERAARRQKKQTKQAKTKPRSSKGGSRSKRSKVSGD